MEKNNIFSEVWKSMTSKEGIRIMRDAQAIQVAGSVVGIAIRNALYKRSKNKGGWYSRYIDHPFVQKWVKADDKSVLVCAVIATALDTILLLDQNGVIKLHSTEEIPDRDLKEDITQTILKHVDVESAPATAKVAETVPPSRDTIDDDEDDEDALY